MNSSLYYIYYLWKQRIANRLIYVVVRCVCTVKFLSPYSSHTLFISLSFSSKFISFTFWHHIFFFHIIIVRIYLWTAIFFPWLSLVNFLFPERNQSTNNNDIVIISYEDVHFIQLLLLFVQLLVNSSCTIKIFLLLYRWTFP